MQTEEIRMGDFGRPTEVTRFEQAQAGCMASLNELIQRHEGLVHLVVQRQFLLTLPYEEAIQAGRRGLWRAILGYDRGQGRAFSTYAYRAIMCYVWAVVKSETRRSKRKLPLGVLLVYCYQTGADPRYADYARTFGFREGVYPTEGGVRHFLTTLGRNLDAHGATVGVEQGQEVIQVAVQKLNLLPVGAVGVMRQTEVLSPKAWQAALLCPDGQLHDAASSLHCISVTESCCQPCTPQQPRRCAAKEKDRQRCECNTHACAAVCRQATPRDREARYVWYTGSNQPASSPNRSTLKEKAAEHEHGEAHYGYRSLPLRLVDPLQRFSLTLLDDVPPANGHEDVPSAALLLQLKRCYPDLQVDAVAGDAGLGFEAFLRTVYAHLHARRVIDRR